MKGITVEDIQNIISKGQAANVKYVRLNDEFRYGIADGPLEHRHLIDDAEVPTSAGFFTLFKGDLFHHSIPSSSLGVGPLPEDEVMLKAIFLEI